MHLLGAFGLTVAWILTGMFISSRSTVEICADAAQHPLTYPSPTASTILPPLPIFPASHQAAANTTPYISWHSSNLQDAWKLLSRQSNGLGVQRALAQSIQLCRSCNNPQLDIDLKVIQRMTDWTRDSVRELDYQQTDLSTVSYSFTRELQTQMALRHRLVHDDLRTVAFQYCSTELAGPERGKSYYGDQVRSLQDDFSASISQSAYVAGIAAAVQQNLDSVHLLRNRLRDFGVKLNHMPVFSRQQDLELWYSSFTDLVADWIDNFSQAQYLTQVLSPFPSSTVEHFLLAQTIHLEALQWHGRYWENAYLEPIRGHDDTTVQAMASTFRRARNNISSMSWWLWPKKSEDNNPLVWTVWRQWYLGDAAMQSSGWTEKAFVWRFSAAWTLAGVAAATAVYAW